MVAAASVALALTTAGPDGSQRPTVQKPLLAGSDVPVRVRAILERACRDCHSADTVWPWYAHIPPISWQIQSDVAKGRAFLDLSMWNGYTDDERRGFSAAIGAAVRNCLMPPAKYLWMHPEARLSGEELEWIRAWVLARTRRAQ